jgi:methyl-accepting chemotaxis protein-1 (serine sensor receptor)
MHPTHATASEWPEDAVLAPRWKTALGVFGAGLVLLMAVAAVGAAMLGIRHRLQDVATNYLPSQLALTQAQAATFRVQRDVRSAILVDDPREIERLLQTAREQLASAARALAAYQALPMSETERRLFAEYASVRRTWQASMEEAMAEVAKNTAAGNRAATAILMERNMPLVREMDRLLDALLAELVRQCEQALRDADATYTSMFGVAGQKASGACSPR